MPTTIARREFAKGVIDQAIRKALAATKGKGRKTFAHLIWNVQSRSDLLRPSRFLGRVRAEELERLVQALLALSLHRSSWLRPVETWEPDGSLPLSLFSSLAHHLLANYPVPPILLSVWFRGTDWRAQLNQRWFKHVGTGGSLRTAGLPARLTRRMAHEFACAPCHLTVEHALRWAQVRGLEGSEKLAADVISSRLGRELDDDEDEFWCSVIRLFVNTPDVKTAQIHAIIDYLHNQKFEYQLVIIGDETEVGLGPPQPELSIKGRTVASLLRRADDWQAERRPATPQKRFLRWQRSAIGGYRRAVDEHSALTIRELLDSDELAAEGKTMEHCVADYIECCLKRSSTIWSLGSEGPDGRTRLVTVEVDPETKQVVQAKMKCNDAPCEPYVAILKDWAQQEGLAIDCGELIGV